MSDYSEKISTLSQKVESLEAELDAADNCFPTVIITAIAAPFLFGIILYFLNPRFIQTEEMGVCHLNKKKLMLWTLVFSGLSWIAMFLVNKYSKTRAKICLK